MVGCNLLNSIRVYFISFCLFYVCFALVITVKDVIKISKITCYLVFCKQLDYLCVPCVVCFG
jgi:hypothetical protein